MSELRTDYYNNKLNLIHMEAEISADLADFISIMDDISSEDFPYESSELFHGIRKGTGSGVAWAFRRAKGLIQLGKWFFRTMRHVTRFIITGYGGDIKSAKKFLEDNKSRLGYVLDARPMRAVSAHVAKYATTFTEKHSEKIGAEFKIKSGTIKESKNDFLAQFNSGLDKSAQIDVNFKSKEAPGLNKLQTLRAMGYTSADELINAGANLISAKNNLIQCLKNLKQGKERSVVSIIKQIQSAISTDENIEDILKNAKITEVLQAAFCSAVIANDIKYIMMLQKGYVDMVEDKIFSKVRNYTAEKTT